MRYEGKAKQKLQAKDKRFAEVYANMLWQGKVDWKQLGRIYRPDDKIPEAKAKRVVRSQYIQNMVTEKLIELTEKHGITAKESLEMRKKLLDMAIEKGDLTNANKALDSFDTKLDLQPVKQQQITTTQTDYLRLIDKETGNELQAKQVKQLKQDNNDTDQS